MKKTTKICICIAHNYPSFDVDFYFSMQNMKDYFHRWNRKAKFKYELSEIVQGGYELDWMRNEVAKKALATGHDYLLFLDTDMTFPPETIPRMLMVLASNKGFNAVCGIYTHKQPPYEPMLYLNWDEKELAFNFMGGGYPLDKPFQISATGGGIVMVHRSVFTEEPYFRFVRPEDKVEGLPNGIGEDMYFFWKFRPKMLCDPQIRCKHYRKQGFGLEDYIEYNQLEVKDNHIVCSQEQLDKIHAEHLKENRSTIK